MSDRLVALIGEIVPELGGEVIGLVVPPEHVHILAHCLPTLAPHQIMARIKDKASHILRRGFPSLRSRLPSLWTSACCVGTAGSVSSVTIRKYIEAHKGV